MISIAKQVIEHFLKTWKKINIVDLKIEKKELLNEKWSIFVTIFSKWEVRWSAWNIKELKDNLVEEVIENTFEAICRDKRFSPLTSVEASDLKIRIDKITDREVIKDTIVDGKVVEKRSILDLDPARFWVIVIKSDYSKMACVLPNINPKLISWADFVSVIKEKFWEKNFVEWNNFIYQIKTEVSTNY